MQVTVEDLSSVKKVLHIEIPEEKVTQEIDKAFKQIKKTAKIRGFRPGKAPRSVLERMFKKDVHADVSSRLIQESFMEVIKENDLKIVGTPEIDPPKIEAKTPYRFDATVEINPEISDFDFKGLELKKTVYKIDQEEIDVQIKMIRKKMAQLKTIETERPVQKTDYVMIDYEGFKDGNPFPATEKTENFAMKIGDATILEELDNQIIGMKPGENKEIAVTFPDDYTTEELAGQKIDFQVQLNEIREEILPEINDEFAKDVGEYENLDDLKQKITENLEQGYTKRTEQELNEQIFLALIKKTSFEVPEALVNAELDGIISDAERSFSYQNKTMEDLGLTREGMAEQYRETAVKQVRRFLIIDKIIDQEKLTLSDDELDQGFENMSKTLNQPLDQIKQFYDQNKDRIEVFKQSLLEKKAMDLIIESSRITEVPPEKEAETTIDEK